MKKSKVSKNLKIIFSQNIGPKTNIPRLKQQILLILQNSSLLFKMYIIFSLSLFVILQCLINKLFIYRKNNADVVCLFLHHTQRSPIQSPSMEYKPQSQHSVGEKSQNKSEEFLKLFSEQLRKTSIKYMKKVWTKQDDKILLDLKNQGYKWTEISEKILNSNPQICKRRYLRLREDQEKWPLQLEQEIKKVCQTPHLKWEQKMKILHSKFPETKKYSKKMIKERYLTYLESTIEQKPWTVEQDLILIKMIQKGIKKWKSIAKAVPGRSELHLKNRYYGCLRNIERKIEKRMQKWN